VLHTRATWGHGPLTLNEHIAADGSYTDESLVQDTIQIARRVYDPQFRDTRDPYHLAQGGGLGRVHKGFGYWRLEGNIYVPDATQLARMDDRERALRAAFDPYLCDVDSPTTDGAYALDYDELTLDTANFASGRIPLRLYARPVSQPSVVADNSDRAARPWSVVIGAADPRRYRQTESTLVLTPGSPSNAVANIGNTPAPLKATIVMSGAGSSTFTIARLGISFILNLSGMANNDTVIVIFETCGPYGRGKLITKNGTENFALKTSSPNTWLNAPVGSVTFTITNTTNVTSCTLAWRSAWA
jgi:hypothetical protein